MKKTVLFVSALKIEIEELKLRIKSYMPEYFICKLLLSSVGNYETIYVLQKYLMTHKVDFIVNIGICGKREEAKNDFFQVYRITNLSSGRESIVPIYLNIGRLASIASSERIITQGGQLCGEPYVDMESFAIDFISTKEKIPYLLLKIPFDSISEKSLQVDKHSIQKKMGEIPYQLLFGQLDKFFMEQGATYDFENIKKHLRFTFSELEIVKKYYYQMRASGFDFDDFYKKNKHLQKKEFLKCIHEYLIRKESIIN